MRSIGLDLGSVAVKAVLVEHNEIQHALVLPARGARLQKGEEFLKRFLKEIDCKRSDVGFVGVTGYGRVSASYADRTFSEIICHAKGVSQLVQEARTVIDIGGQDTKVTKINGKGEVLNFQMNDKCAAGTGRFIETMANALEIPLEEMGAASLKSSAPSSISSICTVFAESEVIGLLADGEPLEDIVAGLHLSVAKRIMSMAQRLGMVDKIALTGGVAQNRGVHRALEMVLKRKIIVPSVPQLTGALGAALLSG